MTKERRWWQTPQLRMTDEEEERRVSWLELFFDLIFVVIVSELAHSLAGHVTWAGIGAFILLFIPAWWMWIGGTFYNSRFETFDVSYRLFTLLQIVAVAAMAIFIHDGAGKTSVPFALAYAGARVLIIAMWLRGGYHVPLMRPITTRYAIGFTLSVALFIASIFVTPPLRFVLWGIGLFSDLVTPLTTAKLQASLPRLSNVKLPERYGLFVIIVLGEAIVAVIRGMAADEGLTLALAFNGLLGIILAFGLWWIYFDFIARRHPRSSIWQLLSWSYLHLPLVMGIAAISAALSKALPLHESELAANLRLLLAGSVSFVLLVTGLIELTLRREADEPTDHRVSFVLKAAASGIALALGLFGAGIKITALLIILVLLIVVQMVYAVYVWFNQNT